MQQGCWNSLSCYLRFLLFHTPFKQTAGMGFWLLQLKLHRLGLHWVEIYHAGYPLLARIGIGTLHLLPVAGSILVVKFPTVWYLATAPWLVIIPIYGAALYLLCLWECVGNPLCGVLLWPPVNVWNGTVVFIDWNQTVCNAALGRNRR